MLPLEFATAIEDARRHATAGLERRPFDSIYVHTLEQLAIIDRHVAAGDLSGLAPGVINVGQMAVKELGNDEQDFAHALHVIQHHADASAEATRKGFFRTATAWLSSRRG